MSVISPWLFYIIELLSNLNFVAGTACFISAVLLGVALFIYAMESDSCYPSENLLKGCKKISKISIISLIISSVMCITIPSEDTMYKMLVAKYVTYENIDKATDTIKDGVDYIFDKLDGDKEDK